MNGCQVWWLMLAGVATLQVALELHRKFRACRREKQQKKPEVVSINRLKLTKP